MFIHLHKLFIFVLLCLYLLWTKNFFLNFALNFKICQYFFMLLLPPSHILQTHASLISKDLSQVIFRIFSMSRPSRQQLKLKFSMSVVILFLVCKVPLQTITTHQMMQHFFCFFFIFFCFFTGSQNERVCHKESRPSLNASMTPQLQTYHTYVTFPLLSCSHAKRLRATTN